MAKVHFRQVTKRYGDLEVIHGIDADVADGEFIVIVGPSGCGKSTLLRMVAGLEAISGGEISDRRSRRQHAGAEGPRHRDGVPELRAVPAYERVRQHGVRPEDPRHEPRRTSTRRSSARRKYSSSARCSSASRGSFPAGSASASRWAARSCASPRCSCSTSPCRTSTPSFACRCASRSRSCIGDWARPACTSRTTRSRR